jgi:hypothetical protein
MKTGLPPQAPSPTATTRVPTTWVLTTSLGIGGYKAGVVGGVFNGYPKAFDGGWFPALLPVATWEGERFGLNIAFVPPLQNRLYGAISFQLKVKLP